MGAAGGKVIGRLLGLNLPKPHSSSDFFFGKDITACSKTASARETTVQEPQVAAKHAAGEADAISHFKSWIYSAADHFKSAAE